MTGRRHLLRDSPHLEELTVVRDEVPVVIEHHDSVRGRVESRLEQRHRLLELPLRRLLPRDVERGADDALDRAVRVAERLDVGREGPALPFDLVRHRASREGLSVRRDRPEVGLVRSEVVEERQSHELTRLLADACETRPHERGETQIPVDRPEDRRHLVDEDFHTHVLLVENLVGEAPFPDQAAAQLELRLDLSRQGAQRALLFLGQLSRSAVQNAEGSERVAVRGPKRRARVEADLGIGRDERVRGETRILGRVGHHEEIALQNGVRAEGDLPRGLLAIPWAAIGRRSAALRTRSGWKARGRPIFGGPGGRTVSPWSFSRRTGVYNSSCGLCDEHPPPPPRSGERALRARAVFPSRAAGFVVHRSCPPRARTCRSTSSG